VLADLEEIISEVIHESSVVVVAVVAALVLLAHLVAPHLLQVLHRY
jgi:preprotein translocase subunit Sec61beta